MAERAESIPERYGRDGLSEDILVAYRAAGKDTDALSRDDIATFGPRRSD